MIVKNISLRNYRNYEKVDISFDEKINYFIGNNGQGKTNLLEAILFLSLTKSHRINDDKKLIKYNSPFTKINSLINDEEDKKMEVIIHQSGKSLSINNIQINKVSDFIGKLNVILFSPDDLFLFNDQPRERRKVIDQEISKINQKYLLTLNKYKNLIKDKNNLLKNKEIDINYLDVLNEQLINESKIIINERKKIIEVLNKNIKRIYKLLSNEDKDIFIEYKCCVEDGNLKRLFEEAKQKEIDYRVASVGPHREDYLFLMDNEPLINIASQGQKRMVVLAFKLSLINYIYQQTNKYPVLLLDDVLSELDKNHRERLINLLKDKNQCIITTTEDIDIKENIKKFYVEDGTVKEI